eukprot:TRINITY_DN13407_c0_g1_i1.p1 TRINITY_DN13407_c0_g1~~TRINITY_DN13407_c0_g1_i1.p1  ORF type:complete len:295 (+),score=77.91 TRINITY_DN13407_c0_g1_i1:120-1004(+)
MPMQRFQPSPEGGQQSFPGKGGKGGRGGKNHFPSYYPPAGPPPLPSPYAYRSTPVQPPPPPPPPPPPAVSGKGKGGRATEVVGTVEITGRHRIGKKTSARRVEEVGDWRCIIEDGKPQWFENIITNEVQTNPPRGFWQQLRGTKKEGKVDPFKGQRGDVQVGDRIWQFCQKFKFGSDIEEELRIHTTDTMRKILDNEYLTESELLADLAKYTPDPDPSTRASRETVLDFIWRHKLDDYAANEFLNLHQEGIDEILAGGDLTAFRNPSAKMTNLTRTAKEELQRKNRLKRNRPLV